MKKLNAAPAATNVVPFPVTSIPPDVEKRLEFEFAFMEAFRDAMRAVVPDIPDCVGVQVFRKLHDNLEARPADRSALSLAFRDAWRAVLTDIPDLKGALTFLQFSANLRDRFPTKRARR